MVNLVTNRALNLYFELLKFLEERDPALGAPPINVRRCLYIAPARQTQRLENLELTSAVGESLPPELPLWLSPDLAIPLDLEASYEQTCRDLRIA
jgi:hypothetical protein